MNWVLLNDLESRFLFFIGQGWPCSTLYPEENSGCSFRSGLVKLGWCCYLRFNSECPFAEYFPCSPCIRGKNKSGSWRHEPWRRGGAAIWGLIASVFNEKDFLCFQCICGKNKNGSWRHETWRELIFTRQMYLREHTPCTATAIFFDGVKRCINNSAILFKCSNLLSI